MPANEPSWSLTCSKMRHMNWSKIPPRKTKGTIWDDLDDAEVLKLIDKEELESLFAANVVPTKVTSSTGPKKKQVPHLCSVSFLHQGNYVARAEAISKYVYRFSAISSLPYSLL